MGALLALSAVTLEGDRPAQTPEMRPNVVVVMTDDQTVEQVQALRRVRGLIGRAGTTFTRNFATFPWCCPSRATYLTGQYSHNHRVRGNRPPAGGPFDTSRCGSSAKPAPRHRGAYAAAGLPRPP